MSFRGFSSLQHCVETFEQFVFAIDDGFFPAGAFLAFFRQAFQLAFYSDQVIQDEFGVHGGDIALRIDASCGMRHFIRFEAAHHMDEAIHLGQVVEQCT